MIYIISLTLVLTMVSCSSQQREVHRPENVPENAQWVGGNDGGAWIYIDQKIDNKLFNVTVWFERGQEWTSGKHELICPCMTESYGIDEIRELANSYTGNMLKLKKLCYGNSCFLKLIDS